MMTDTNAPDVIYAHRSMAQQMTRPYVNVFGETGTSYIRTDLYEALQAENERLRGHMAEFVKRVERGEIRSKKTYLAFCRALATTGQDR